MKKELVMQQLRLLSSMMSIPVSVYQDGSFLCSFSPTECGEEFTRMWRGLIQDQTDNPCYILTDAMILFGEMRQEETGFTIDVGPVRCGTVSFQVLCDFLFSLFPWLNEENARDISLFLSSCKTCSTENFRHFLHLLYSIVTGNNPEDSLADSEGPTHQEGTYGKDSVFISSDEVFSDYERKLLYYVQNGLVAPLRQMPTYPGEIPSLAEDSLRLYKNAYIIMNSLCLRAAIAGGLEPEISYTLGLTYIQKIESCQTVSELIHLSENMRIPVDYAERVAGVIFPNVSDPHVQKAIRYIRRNFQQGLTVGQIASEVHLSKEYLSSRFHAETGMTIPAYITRQKVIAAKELLTFTDTSLIDITYFLSFSSQSYFQSVFRKIVGETPQAYRQRTRRRS